jgi:hypothetical protein
MTLFQRGAIVLHSGRSSWWKIECDSLDNDDLDVLAQLIAERVRPFSSVEGVPTGGLRLADALRPYASRCGDLLIVDDVYTTGGSMEEHRAGRDALGAVVFSRGSCPEWIIPLFQLSPAP